MRRPVPLAVLNYLALEGYEVREKPFFPEEWIVVRISDNSHADTWAFDSPVVDYVDAMRVMIGLHRQRRP